MLRNSPGFCCLPAVAVVAGLPGAAVRRAIASFGILPSRARRCDAPCVCGARSEGR